VLLVGLSGLLMPGVDDNVQRVAVTALVAAAIGPLRRFVQRRVDHLIHGEAREPMRMVGRIGRGIDASGTPTELLVGVLDDLASLPFGALRLTERYLRDGASPKALKKLRREVRAGIKSVMPRADWRGAQVIGSGGTFTNLASIHLARRGMLSARNVHETVVPRVDVEHILDTLAAMSTEERRGVPKNSDDRDQPRCGRVRRQRRRSIRLDADHGAGRSSGGICCGWDLTARVVTTTGNKGSSAFRSVAESSSCAIPFKNAVAARTFPRDCTSTLPTPKTSPKSLVHVAGVNRQ